MPLDIRPYRDTDHDQVVALWRVVFPDLPPHRIPEVDIRCKLDVQRELFLLAVEDDTVIGTAMAGYDGHRGWVHYVAVHPVYRDADIGTALMQRVESELRAVGCQKINLQVRESNRGVIAFYEKLGYRLEPVVSMGKLLSSDRR